MERVGLMITYPTDQDLLLLICFCNNSPRESQERKKEEKGPEGKKGEKKIPNQNVGQNTNYKKSVQCIFYFGNRLLFHSVGIPALYWRIALHPKEERLEH